MSTRPTDTRPSLLPPQATELERDIEQATVRATAIPTPMDTVWNADTCPPALLGWLAWAVSVDEWDPSWPDDVKRDAIKTAPLLHKRKGTLWSLENALNQFGLQTNVREWWDASPMGAPGTFEVVIEPEEESYETIGSTLTPLFYQQMKRVIDSNKPVSRSYKMSIAMKMPTRLLAANIFNAAQALATDGHLKPFGISNFETPLGMGGLFTPSQSINSSGALSPLGAASNTSIQTPGIFGIASAISTSGTLQ